MWLTLCLLAWGPFLSRVLDGVCGSLAVEIETSSMNNAHTNYIGVKNCIHLLENHVAYTEWLLKYYGLRYVCV